MPSFLTRESISDNESEFNLRFESSLKFFKKRSPVIFVSQHYRFWDSHGFVQQSLAKVLTDSGIPVYWLDGAHWKRNPPVKTWNSPILNLSQLPCLPLRRVPFIEALNPNFQLRALKKKLKLGTEPFLWVQSGLDERVVAKLPYVDVFSVFDDPYLHSPDGQLSSKAKVIATQNDFTKKLFEKSHSSKTIILFPPVDMTLPSFCENSEFYFPDNFPKKTMGYIGSFFSQGFDLLMFEDFIRSLPDWGFVLCGRTDSFGLKKIETWKRYKNFIYFPWVPRAQLGALWKKINLNLMLYRPESTSHGAFPVKFLEALYYRVPSITTCVPKTSSLEGAIPRFLFPEQLKSEAVKEALNSSQLLDFLYERFSFEMNPKIHLIRIAEAAQK